MPFETEFLSALTAIVGAQNLLSGAAEMEPYTVDARSRYHGQALAVVKPASTQEVAAIVRLCARHDVVIVPQGGNTGMCGAATPFAGRPAIIVRLDRMNRILAINPADNSITVEAGSILAEIQNAADGADRLFPLSLGAEGSCQIGGNISTNAGGTAVLRYGPMRDLVLGLEVVLANGEVLDTMRRLRKDNTGYDLKQAFIGAEGTLGIVTKAVLKLFPKPRQSAVAMAALPNVEKALDLLALIRTELGDRLSSFEIISASQVETVEEHVPDIASPFERPYPWYMLIEVTDVLTGFDLRGALEQTLERALEAEIIEDAVIPASGAQIEALWRIRHSVTEANLRAGPGVSHDTSVPVDRQPAFVAEVEKRIGAAFPEAKILMVGHIGDGNIHVIALFEPGRFVSPEAFEEAATAINAIVDDVVISLEGSVSAEHGIGYSNRKRLLRNAGPLQIALMRKLKDSFDPQGIMNPDKLFLPDETVGS